MNFSFGLLILVTTNSLWAAGPVFVAETIDGKTFRGTVASFNPNEGLKLLGPEGGIISPLDLTGVYQENEPLPPFPTGSHLVLSNHDRLPFSSIRLTSEKFQIVNANLHPEKVLEIPLTVVRLLWREAPSPTEDAERFRRFLGEEIRNQDVLHLTNGDKIAGTIEETDERKLEIVVDSRKSQFDWVKVAAVGFNTELMDAIKSKDRHYRAILSDGTRITLSEAIISDGKVLAGSFLTEQSLRIPLKHLIGLEVKAPNIVSLTDLKPSRYEMEPYLDWKWPLIVDGSVTNHDLRLGKSTFDRGLGMHATSRVTYSLSGNFQRFIAMVGLDPRWGSEGRSRIQILADGKPVDLGLKRELVGKDELLRVNIEIKNVKDLVLEVLPGRRGDVQAHVNWVNTRLLRK